MKCPFCVNMENKVIDSRLSKDGQVIRRRRECNDCGRRFTTYERVEEILPTVVRRDGRREPFDRREIIAGIRVACAKRAGPVTVIDQLVDDIEKQLQETGEKEVESSMIGEEVHMRLSEIDDVAYIRYAASYRDFADVAEFSREIDATLADRKRRTRLVP